MAFSKGDKVRGKFSKRPAEVVVGEPDSHGHIVIRYADRVSEYTVERPENLSPLPRTLAEVEPGVACRVNYGCHHYTAFRTPSDGLNNSTALYINSDGSIQHCVWKPHALTVIEQLGPVKTVIEGRE